MKRSVPTKFAKELASLTGDDIRVEALGQRVIPIRKSMVGKVLGKDQATLKSIKGKSGARVGVHNKRGRNPRVEITGEASEVKSAEKLIGNIIWPRGKTIKVNEMHLGTVIGAGGRHIKKIQEVTGAKIKLPPKKRRPNGNGEVSIVISGTKEQIQEAEERIRALLDTMMQKYKEQLQLQTEIHTVGCKLYLKHIDKSIKADDLMNLYRENPKPKIMIRMTKVGDGKYATCTFASAALAKGFMEHLGGTILGSRQIVCKL